jgi:adenylosuccinate lyase
MGVTTRGRINIPNPQEKMMTDSMTPEDRHAAVMKILNIILSRLDRIDDSIRDMAQNYNGKDKPEGCAAP